MRINLGMAKEEISDIAEINMASNDPRLVRLINRCQERIIEESRGELLHRRIRMCIYENCITAPVGVASFTDAALCTDPLPIRNQWYEFLLDRGTVFTEQNEGGCGISLHDRGEACTFSDIQGTTKKLKIYTDIAETEDTYMYFYGHNQNDVPIRTDHTGLGVELKDGERINLNGAGPFTTTNYFRGSLVHVDKPRTKSRVRLYELDTSNNAERLIAIYEYFELLPSYRRYLVRGQTGCTSCGPATLTAMAKLDYIPAQEDEDLLLIPSMEALRMMAKAVKKFDNGDEAAGAALSREAMRRMGLHRDHVSPVEQLAVSLRAQGTARGRMQKIGMVI